MSNEFKAPKRNLIAMNKKKLNSSQCKYNSKLKKNSIRLELNK